MPRTFGALHTGLWSEPDWRNLTVGAQHLYMALVSDPTLSYAGVADWRPKRMAQRAEDWTPGHIWVAAQELSWAHYVVVDEDSEEVMLRSFIRTERIMLQPKLAVSALKAYDQIASSLLRAVFVHELKRIRRENPDAAVWDHQQAKRVLGHTSVDAKKDVSLDLTLPEGLELPLAQALRQG